MSPKVEKRPLAARSKRQHANISEDVILAAAGRLFHRFGYSKVTMEEIALEAGHGKASLYYYFPAKEHLFAAVVRALQEKFLAEVEQIIGAGDSVGAKLDRYLDLRFSYFDMLQSFRFMETEPAVKRKPVIVNLFTNFRDQELRLLRKIFRAAKAAGEIETGSADTLADLFMHILHGLRLRYMYVVSPGADDEQKALSKLRAEARMTAEIFLKGVASPAARKMSIQNKQSTLSA